MQKIYTASVNLTNNTYENCQTITQVDLMQTPWVNNSMVDAFNNCSNLHTVTNINSQVNSLANAFKNCQNLVNAPVIPPNVTNMYETFRWCSNLAEIPTLPDDVSNLNGAFSACYNLATTPTIPNSVGSSLNSTFYECTSLTTHTPLPDSATLLHSTFVGCSGLTSIPAFSTNVINLYETYYGCLNLTTIPNIPSNVTDMYHTFGACVNISGDINILSDKVVNVTNLFGETSARKNVYIPPVCYNDISINSPTYNAFIAAGYDNIGTKDGVYLMYNYAPALPSDWITSTAANNTIVLEKYIGTNTTVVTPHNDWYSNKVLNTSSFSNGPFTNNINVINIDLANVEVINNNLTNAFKNCYNLKTVTNINQAVTNMRAAFSECNALEIAPNLPSSVLDLGATFSYDYNLTQAPTIPNSVIEMGGKNSTIGTFYGCSNLVIAPTIPQSVVNFFMVFEKCYALNNVPAINIPNAINCSHAFSDCNNLTDINITAPNATNVMNIFNGCTNLTNVYAEFNSISDFSNLFNNCKNLSNVVLLSQNSVNLSDTFRNCSSLTTVIIPNSVTNIERTFFNCTSLINAPTIPNNAISMLGTFSDCNNLINVPSIPNSVTSMIYTFKNCSNLVNAPILPSNVIDLGGAFMNCTNLNVAPDIPNGVTNMCGTFLGCVNLINVPVIPASVICIGSIPFEPYGTFENCTSLSGNIYIHSENISRAYKCFYGTSLQKNVYIPFEYENGVATSTYNAFINAGYGTDEYLHGVHLKDIDGSRITINPTPADATVLMYNETTGTEVDEEVLNKFSYTSINGNVEIQALNTNDTTIVVPSQWIETNRMRAPEGSIIHYRVYKDGYYPVESQVIVDGSQTINVNLEQIMCIYTVVPMPIDATVTLTSNAEIQLCAYTSSGGYGTIYLNPNDSSDDQLYNSKGQPYSAGDIIEGTSNTLDQATVYMWQSNPRIYVNNGTLTICPVDPEKNIGVQRTIIRGGGYSPSFAEFENSIVVPWGTEVSYTVSKAHYTAVTGTEIVKTTGSRYVPLAIDQHTFTINPTPADAAVQILVNGKLVNASNSDWVFTANNANGDIELQEYIGSNTVVSMPTSYETTNTVTADYGSTIEWKVSKEHYRTQTDILTLTEDTTLTIALEETERRLDVTDYTYTNENNIVTLTGYIGNGGDIDTPEIEEV